MTGESPILSTVPNAAAADLTARLDRIQKLTDALAKSQRDAVKQQELAERIHREIRAAKESLRPLRVVPRED